MSRLQWSVTIAHPLYPAHLMLTHKQRQSCNSSIINARFHTSHHRLIKTDKDSYIVSCPQLKTLKITPSDHFMKHQPIEKKIRTSCLTQSWPITLEPLGLLRNFMIIFICVVDTNVGYQPAGNFHGDPF